MTVIKQEKARRKALADKLSNISIKLKNGLTICFKSTIFLLTENEDFVEINPEENTFWTGLFANCFLCTDNDSVKNSLTHDDMLFFVSKINLEENKIEVFRRDSKKLPCLTDFNFDWEETVYLNLILHEVKKKSKTKEKIIYYNYLFRHGIQKSKERSILF